MVYFINTHTFAAMDFGRRPGASDEHIPQWICEERATTPPAKRHAALWVAPNLPVASLLGRSGIAADTLPPSRLATGQIGRNERMRIYEIDHLVRIFRTSHEVTKACGRRGQEMGPFLCASLGRPRGL